MSTLAPWQKILCILGLVALLHWYIFMEWRHRSLARAVRSLRKMAQVARDPWAEERAVVAELRERVAQLQKDRETATEDSTPQGGGDS